MQGYNSIVKPVGITDELRTNNGMYGMIGLSVQMRAVYRMIQLVAPIDETVVLIGESGTGKELIAKAIHAQSGRTGKFLGVNCAAIPENLVESYLFGHVRGAFTGATYNREGYFAQAENGTLLLDELGEMPLEAQVKLLRVLEEHEYHPVGSSKHVHTNTRIITASSKSLEDEVRRGEFREDLMSRLYVAPIYVPPLRERKEDIRLLTQHAIDNYSSKIGRNVYVDEDGFSLLESAPWKGNVRELINFIRRAIIFNEEAADAARNGKLDRVLLEKGYLEMMLKLSSEGSKSGTSDVSDDQESLLRIAERQAVLDALEQTDYNVLRAAKLLGINRTTLYRKIRRYGLPSSLE